MRSFFCVVFFLVVGERGAMGESAFASTPETVNAQSLTFAQALMDLEKSSTEIQEQKSRLNISELEWAARKTAFLPTIRGEFSQQQTERPTFAQIQPVYLLGSLNLFHFGADLASVRGAEISLHRQSYLLKQAELDSEQIHVELLIHYIQAIKQLDVTNNILQLSQELAAIEKARYDRGLIPLQESQRATVEQSNALARREDAQVNFDEAKSRLSARLGDFALEPQWPWLKDLETIDLEKGREKSISLSQIPQINAANLAVEMEEQNRQSQLREFLPSLDFSVAYGYADFRNRDEGQNLQFVSTLTLKIPLFDLNQHYSYKVQLEKKSLAQISQERTRQDLTGRWEQTLKNLRVALRSAQQRQSSLLLAQSLYHDNLLRLKAGRSSMNDILVDQNRLAEAEILAIRGWANAHILYAQYCHLGGRKVIENLGEMKRVLDH